METVQIRGRHLLFAPAGRPVRSGPVRSQSVVFIQTPESTDFHFKTDFSFWLKQVSSISGSEADFKSENWKKLDFYCSRAEIISKAPKMCGCSFNGPVRSGSLESRHGRKPSQLSVSFSCQTLKITTQPTENMGFYLLWEKRLRTETSLSGRPGSAPSFQNQIRRFKPPDQIKTFR